MIEISVTLLAASAVLFAQTESVAVNTPPPSVVPDVRQIVESSLAATERHWHARLRYTYMERSESRRRDMDGRVKSEDVEISNTTLVNDVPFEQVMERNGQPPSTWDQWRQKTALEKVKRETSAQRAEQVREQEKETTSLVQEVPKAFDFQLVGQELVNGRGAYVLRATPHAGYQARGTYGKVFSKVEGTLWIDTQDLVWIKVDGRDRAVLDRLVSCAPAAWLAQVTIEQTRVDDGNWMPLRVEIRAAAKVFLVKSLVIERVIANNAHVPPLGVSKVAVVDVVARDCHLRQIVEEVVQQDLRRQHRQEHGCGRHAERVAEVRAGAHEQVLHHVAGRPAALENPAMQDAQAGLTDHK